MCVQYHIAGGTLDRRFRFFFFVKNEFFLNLVDEHENDQTYRLVHPRLLFWEDWGVENTRFMAYGMQPRWLRYVHGLKVVCPPHPSDRSEWACVLEVFDFNIHPKKLRKADNTAQSAVLSHASDHEASEGAKADTGRGRTDDSNSSTPATPSSPSSSSPGPGPDGSRPTIGHEVSYTVHTEPSKISASGVFVNDVVSKLPYTHAVRRDLCAVYSGFMIDDERIVGLKASPDGEMGDIDVFVF